MKKNKKYIYFVIVPILLSSCKVLENRTNEMKQDFGEDVHQKNNIEITISCGEDNDLKKYIDEGWYIIKEYSEEKICSWKSVPATKNCNIDKDKGCKIIKPDKIGEEKFYLLEKNN
tara:strand:- start:52 stop:399 length:348 start_codon:yes stop_codon:yes gene_type:complete